MTTKPAIGFCGLGAMGFGMATHLVKSGYAVTGFDVWAPTLEKFAAAGGTPSTSLRASAQDKAFYVCMVATAKQAQDAIFGPDGILEGLPAGATLYLCSTVPSAYAAGVDKELGARGRGDVMFVDAPVSGGAVRAAEGTLSIMAGASEAAFEKGRWLLEEMAAPKKLFVVRGGVGAGSNMKMVHQVLAAVHILAVSEAFGFAARLGLNGGDVREAVVGGEAWSWMFENRSVRTLAEDYFPGASAVTIVLKDAGIITSMGRLLGFPLPLCSITEQVFFSGLDKGFGPNDDAGLVRLWTSEPVSSIQSTYSEDDKKAKLKLVTDLLTGIHLCAAAESLAFAKHVGIPLAQMYELVVEAAGGSAVFKDYATKMIPILEGNGTEDATIPEAYFDGLKKAVQEAQGLQCPLYLGNGALSLLLQTGKTLKLKSLLGLYSPV
ncbi:unnamed protein product [Periconia digitata]|uniref:Oxidoreductase-like protein n=1 Tax=Periconia digitata TaxID=1303443 RepID=A0A9W4UGE7_9PLEO|nr:unnamed protein product [Periconia digitata]